MNHIPVLLKEVLKIFNPQPGEIYIDATINGGGHARAILERIGSTGKLLGIDWDCTLIEKLKVKCQKSNVKCLYLTCDNYANLRACAGKYNLDAAHGILFDLGFSSYHLEASQRGFSFLKDEPLDMRYNPETNELTAAKIINTWPEAAIADILRQYGEERFSRRIAAGIVRTRRNQKIATTGELIGIIQRSVRGRFGSVILRREPKNLTGSFTAFRMTPRLRTTLTRTFQALRIAVNKELENLEKALPEASALLRPGGKLIVISFHSLEDRIVKNFLRERAKADELAPLTKKPIIASREEIKLNSRARSAKLRAAEKK